MLILGKMFIERKYIAQNKNVRRLELPALSIAPVFSFESVDYLETDVLKPIKYDLVRDTDLGLEYGLMIKRAKNGI